MKPLWSCSSFTHRSAKAPTKAALEQAELVEPPPRGSTSAPPARGPKIFVKRRLRAKASAVCNHRQLLLLTSLQQQQGGGSPTRRACSASHPTPCRNRKRNVRHQARGSSAELTRLAQGKEQGHKFSTTQEQTRLHTGTGLNSSWPRVPGCAGAQINSRFVPSIQEYSLSGGEMGVVQQGEASTPPARRTWRTPSWELCTNRGRRRRLLGPRSHPGASPSLGYRCFWKALGSPSAGWHSARGTCSKASREIHRSSPDLHLFTTPGGSSRDGERGRKEWERPGKGRAEVRGGGEPGET